MVAQLKPSTGKDDKVHADLTKRSNEFPDADVILFHAGRLAETYKKKAEATQAHGKARRIFKSTGVTIKTFDLVDDISQQDDPKAALDKFVREAMHIAGAMGVVPQNVQVDLFKGSGSPLEAKDKARQEGRARGIMGLSPDEQAYPNNTELGQEHLQGFYDGQEVLQKRFVALNAQMAQEEADKKAAAAEKERKRVEREAKAGARTSKEAGGASIQ